MERNEGIVILDEGSKETAIIGPDCFCCVGAYLPTFH